MLETEEPSLEACWSAASECNVDGGVLPLPAPYLSIAGGYSSSDVARMCVDSVEVAGLFIIISWKFLDCAGKRIVASVPSNVPPLEGTPPK